METEIQFFATQEDFRSWLATYHLSARELIVGFYKVASGKPSMTWSQSVDQALCFGWIDGKRKSIDAESYCIRFTPRKPTSIWSTINIRKIEALQKAGLMQEAGLKAYNLRKENKSAIYYHEQEAAQLPSDYEKQFKAHPQAWAFFYRQAPSYRKNILHWIMSARQDKTRLSRLAKTIQESENDRRVKLF